MAEETLVPFEHPRGKVPLATHVRTTLVCSSLQSLRTHGFFGEYLKVLPPNMHETMLGMTAGQWVPIAIAEAHYSACDGLMLPPTTVSEMGADVAKRVHKTILGVAVKLSREVGATPWIALGQTRRLRDVTWQGGDCAVFKLGPKEGRFEWTGMPCARFRYYRAAFSGFLRSHLELFCQRAYTTPITKYCTDTTLGYKMSWV